MIDAHVHFWRYDKIKDPWITDEMKVLKQDFLPEHLQAILDENKIEGVIAVQADQHENETEFLLTLAKANPFIKGIVGWVDLQNEQIGERLFYYSQSTLIKGFRHIVQAESSGFLQNKKFLNGIKLLQNFGFTYDVLIYENQLKEAIEFVSRFPGQKFIIDHCAKPLIKNKKIREWEKLIYEISENKNVYCKLSGLITEAEWHQWNEKDLYPYLDVVFETFSVDNIVFGSDWPVMLLSGTYNKWRSAIEVYMADSSLEEKQKVFEENAIKFYNLYS